MEYCGPIWQNASKCALNKLDTIQRKVCHLIGKKQNVIPEYNINSLEERRNLLGVSNSQNDHGCRCSQCLLLISQIGYRVK